MGEVVGAFSAGDEVFGTARPHTFRHGSFAEYMPPHTAPAPQPAGLDPVAAAALPMTGGTAFATLDWLGLGAGEVLIVGATGGVGSYAIQLAAAAGVHGIATAVSEDHAYARDPGAAETIDHRTTDTARSRRGASRRDRRRDFFYQAAPEHVSRFADLVTSRHHQRTARPEPRTPLHFRGPARVRAGPRGAG